MNGVIFNLDGVLVDSMPKHYEAWKIAFSETVNIELNERTIYLHEGMRGIELINSRLRWTGLNDFDSIVAQITKRKDEYFSFKPFERVNELVTNLLCHKALVSCSSKKDVESILDQAIGFWKEQFDVMISADEDKNGKPDPSSLLSAVGKLKARKAGSIIVKNASLGVEAANRAGIPCIVVFNNSPPRAIDFKPLVSDERIPKRTELAFNFLKWYDA
jgi:beta-phosphoglucomutase